jgi:hypothetical protein
MPDRRSAGDAATSDPIRRGSATFRAPWAPGRDGDMTGLWTVVAED